MQELTDIRRKDFIVSCLRTDILTELRRAPVRQFVGSAKTLQLVDHGRSETMGKLVAPDPRDLPRYNRQRRRTVELREHSAALVADWHKQFSWAASDRDRTAGDKDVTTHDLFPLDLDFA